MMLLGARGGGVVAAKRCESVRDCVKGRGVEDEIVFFFVASVYVGKSLPSEVVYKYRTAAESKLRSSRYLE